ncbi:MAG: hypothetical protein PVG73_06005 [Desulfobacterales bacterium]
MTKEDTEAIDVLQNRFSKGTGIIRRRLDKCIREIDSTEDFVVAGRVARRVGKTAVLPDGKER